MTQFHEGQEVEVNGEHVDMPRWEKAKIVKLPHAPNALDDGRKYTVQFTDGTCAVADAENIRAIGQRRGPFESEDLNKELRKYEEIKCDIESKSFPSWKP